MSKLIMITGPMFSGKTTELIRRIRRYTVAKKKVLTIKYELDTRYSFTDICSHSGQAESAVISCEDLENILYMIHDYDIIAIDEAQFYRGLREFVFCALDKNKTVIIAGLDGDYKQQMFETITELYLHADELVKLTSICYQCSSDAPYTLRISHDTERCVIGGSDIYQPVCRTCLYKIKN